MSIRARDRLIFAMDVPDAAAARLMAEKLGDSVTFYMLRIELCMAGGYFELLDWLVSRAKQPPRALHATFTPMAPKFTHAWHSWQPRPAQ